MKKFVLVALLLVAMTQVSMAEVKDPGKIEAQLKITSSASNQKKATIQISNLTEGQKTFLRIKDKKGRLLHAETIHGQSSFAKTYDFSTLREKEYLVEVRTKEGRTAQTFYIEEKEDALYFKPVVKTEADMIKVVFQNPLNAPLSLQLYNEEGQVIYKTKVLSQQVFATGLDVSHLKNKQYSLKIRGENYSYSKNISMR